MFTDARSKKIILVTHTRRSLSMWRETPIEETGPEGPVCYQSTIRCRETCSGAATRNDRHHFVYDDHHRRHHHRFSCRYAVEPRSR